MASWNFQRKVAVCVFLLHIVCGVSTRVTATWNDAQRDFDMTAEETRGGGGEEEEGEKKEK